MIASLAFTIRVHHFKESRKNLSEAIVQCKPIAVAFKAIPDVKPNHFCLQVVITRATFSQH